MWLLFMESYSGPSSDGEPQYRACLIAPYEVCADCSGPDMDWYYALRAYDTIDVRNNKDLAKSTSRCKLLTVAQLLRLRGNEVLIEKCIRAHI